MDVQVMEVVPLSGGMFSAQLVPQIASLLQTHGLSKADIGAFIVVSGPGSFTGLRVGLAAIKALAEILQKPIVSVSLLEAIATASRAEGKVVAVLDAGRNEALLRSIRNQRRKDSRPARRDSLKDRVPRLCARRDNRYPGRRPGHRRSRRCSFSSLSRASRRQDARRIRMEKNASWRDDNSRTIRSKLHASLRRRDFREEDFLDENITPRNIVQIRLATLADVPCMMLLERQSATAGHWTEDQYRQALESESTKRLVLVIESSPTTPPSDAATSILGFLVAQHIAPEWELENIVVAPTARRKGLGKRLLQHLLSVPPLVRLFRRPGIFPPPLLFLPYRSPCSLLRIKNLFACIFRIDREKIHLIRKPNGLKRSAVKRARAVSAQSRKMFWAAIPFVALPIKDGIKGSIRPHE